MLALSGCQKAPAAAPKVSFVEAEAQWKDAVAELDDFEAKVERAEKLSRQASKPLDDDFYATVRQERALLSEEVARTQRLKDEAKH